MLSDAIWKGRRSFSAPIRPPGRDLRLLSQVPDGWGIGMDGRQCDYDVATMAADQVTFYRPGADEPAPAAVPVVSMLSHPAGSGSAGTLVSA